MDTSKTLKIEKYEAFLIKVNYKSIFIPFILKNIKRLYIPFGLFIGGLLPFIADSVLGEGLTRAGVTIFSSDLTVLEKLTYIIKGILIHFSPGYLMLGETTTLRHSTGYLGVLLIPTAVFFFSGFISLFVHNITKISTFTKYYANLMKIRNLAHIFFDKIM